MIKLTNPPATLLNTWITSIPAFLHAMTASAAESPAPTITTGFKLIFSVATTFSSADSNSGNSYLSHGGDLFSPLTPRRLTRSLPPFAKTTLLHAIKNGFFETLSKLLMTKRNETVNCERLMRWNDLNYPCTIQRASSNLLLLHFSVSLIWRTLTTTVSFLKNLSKLIRCT